MDFLADEAEESSDVLVPSSQLERSPRSRKRRRLDPDLSNPCTQENDYDLPAHPDGEGKENKKSKYDDRIYVPAGESHPDTFVTQLTQQYSSPSRIRGPRWMKPRKPPSPSPSPRKSLPPTYASTALPSPSAPKSLPLTHVSTRPTPQALPVDDEFDVDDTDELELLAALDDVEAGLEVLAANNIGLPANGDTIRDFHHNRSTHASAPRQPLQKSSSFRQTTLHGIHTTQAEPPRTQSQSRAHNWPLANRNEPPTHHEIDRDAMSTWVYPTNLGRTRDYQYNIVHKGLFHNVLVALPTGLGKTFIAATVMLNWYRWTKNAQIIFVAPTKPLVSQQIDACFNIAGIPRSQTTMLTGEVAPAIRAEEWQQKRVFFMTPQTLINDLKHGYCDPKKVVLVVVDEAHKATGSYAYVEVVKFLRRYNSSFRVLALTATPGKDVETVQEVIDGLGIARVEIRTEDSLDIRDFVHNRNIQTEVFENSEEMTMVLELLSATLQPLLNKLHSQGAAWGKDPTRITLFGLKMSWDKWQSSEAGRRAPQAVKGMIKAISTVLMSLAHNIELLKYHGIGPFYHKMKMFVQEAGSGKTAKQVTDNEHFKKMMNRLALWINDPDFEGHPKLSYLKRVVLNHFMNAGEGTARTASEPTNTRIMVFAHYRDSAEEIVRVLNRHGPMIRAHVFVGQSGTKGGSEGMNQKTQLEIIQKFKAGEYNTIVATSIGEEGLDIGEVDLIVCYDCSKSPIRMLQRMGRTGRKRAGNIVLLMMRGKEEQDFAQSEDNYQKMQAKIASGREFNFHEELSPRIVPKEIVPEVDKRVIEIPVENTQPGSVEPTRKRGRSAKKPPKKFHMPDGVETGFAFLGNGNKKSKVKQRGTVTPKPERDDEPAPLASLKELVLSEKEERQLEDRYVQLAGSDDEYIQFVRFDAFPEHQRRLGRTSFVRHSKKTKTLVRAYKAMNIPNRDWDRPTKCEEIKDDDLCLDSGAEKSMSATKPSAKKTKAKFRLSPTTMPVFEGTWAESDTEAYLSRSKAKFKSISLTGRSGGTLRSSSVGQYDDNDSFINDDEEEDAGCASSAVPWRGSEPQGSERGLQDDLSSLASLRSTLSPTSAPGREAGVTKRFFVSQESIDYDAMDDELPDLEELVSDKKRRGVRADEGHDDPLLAYRSISTARSETGDTEKPKLRSRKRARRIVDSDDDE
ncbi:fanconi anemia group M protein [Cladophialophora yegresii CBS 114405]|uniref:ATP-dependent DNA helicase n=1 Tax=Cladophialophora yegresii CBS 114405 TaxID=1182544 RepID=W9VYN7_9EURO|nr:fanconi anemia group M protein [Cladophialophora yegresii CBS 114405]EXJ60937.1 fanconi anemia group M protein [Cladophialophora yegresii CBS 114405]